MEICAKSSFLQVHNEVSQLCKPLFDNSDIDYFEMQQSYPDGTFVSLTNKPLLTKIYLEDEIYCTDQELKNSTRNSDFIIAILSSDIYHRAAYQERKAEHNIKIANNLGIYHRIYIVQKRVTHFNLFGFGCCSNNSQIISTMLSNIDLLLKFGAYFEVISQPLIKKCQKKPIYLPKYNESKPIPEIKFLIERDKILNDIHSHKSRALLKKHNDTDLIKQKYNLISYTNFSTLSIRENECLSLIAKGYTAKEVARVLGLSLRTVEEYINRIKNKLGCFSRRELISTFAHFTQKGF